MHSTHHLGAGAEKKEPTVDLKKAWLVCFCASLFFFYEFIQMNMFNAISTPLMHVYHLNATQLGRLSSAYFVSNVLFLFPAGIILDRLSTRKVILVSLLLCVLGTALFAVAPTEGWAAFFRFLTGIGSAFCFLSCIRIASRWFPAKRLALVTGFVVTMAMVGGMVAQTPLILLVQVVKWRGALLVDAGFGLVVLLIIALFVQDYPQEKAEEQQQQKHHLQQLGYWKSMAMAFLRLQNWLGGIYTCLMNLPLILLGGLWGTLYLSKVHHLTQVQASYITSMLFVGTIFGAPLAGWFSDRIGRRKFPMFLGGILSLLIMWYLLTHAGLSMSWLLLLFFLIGFVTSTQIISYPIVTEGSPQMLTAMSVSVVSFTCMGGQVVFQPLFGWLMDLHSSAVLRHGHVIYSAGDFRLAMLIFPVSFVIAMLAVCFIHETYCQVQC